MKFLPDFQFTEVFDHGEHNKTGFNEFWENFWKVADPNLQSEAPVEDFNLQFAKIVSSLMDDDPRNWVEF